MNRPRRPAVLFDQATPLGADASGRYYLAKGAEEGGGPRVLKRFEHAGWAERGCRQVLAQQLWRLAALERPELPGLMLDEGSLAEGEAPPACTLDVPAASLRELRLPMAPPDAEQLIGGLLASVWAMHEARVAGLRFEADSLRLAPDGSWRWLAPDLLPPGGTLEAACREDLVALARFGRELTVLAAGSALERALSALASPEPTPASALQQALAVLDLPVPRPTLPAGGPLAGCESELETLGAWLRKCAQERRLHVLWLGGEPGALAWDLCEALAAEVKPAGMRVAIARCEAAHTPEVFLDGLVRQLATLGGAKSAALIAEPPDGLPPALARLRLRRLFRALLLEVAAEAPLCLALLGFDGADAAIRDLVSSLRHEAAGLPVLLVLGHDGEAHVPAEDAVLDLRPLFRSEVEDLARLNCPGLTLGLAAIDAAWAFSGGQPAQLYRLCLHWLRGGGLRQDPSGAYVPRDDGPRLVPPEHVREFLRAFATLGPTTSLPTLRALMDAPLPSFFELLEAAIDGGWVRQEVTWLAFWRPTEARAFAEHMPPEEAARWHRRLTTLDELPLATRAYHATRSGQDLLALPLALGAGWRLLALGALEAAARQFQLGLAAAASEPERRVELLEGLASVRLEAHEPAAGLGLIKDALAMASTPESKARLAALEGRALQALGEPEQAREAFERALDGAPSARARINLGLAELAYSRGERALGQGFAARAYVESQGSSEAVQAEAQLAVARGLAEGGVEPGQLLAALALAVSLAEQTHHLEVLGRARALEAAAYLATDRPAIARERAVQSKALLTELGDSVGAEAAAVEAACCARELGLAAAAVAELEALDIAGWEHTYPARWARATACRAAAGVLAGQLDEPLAKLERALATAQGLGEPALELGVAREHVWTLLFLGKLTRAEGVCQAALDRAAALDDRRSELVLRLDLAEIVWRQADAERGQRLYEHVLEASQALGFGVLPGRARVGLARIGLERNELAAATAHAEAAAALATEAQHPGLATEAAQVGAELLLASHKPEAARALFNRALTLAEFLSGPHHAAQALWGLGQCAEGEARDHHLAQAAERLNGFVERLTNLDRKDFSQRPERRRIVGGPARGVATSLPGTRSALFELLKQERQAATGALPDSLALLDQIFALVSARLPLDELLVKLNATFLRIGLAERGLVYLANEDDQLKLRDEQAGPDAQGAPRHGMEPVLEVLARVQASGATLWVADARAVPEFAELPEVAAHGIRGLLCVPLLVQRPGGGERVLGCLYGDRLTPWEGIGERELGLLELLARYIGVTLEIGLLQDESARRSHRIQMLNDLSRALAGTLDLDRLLGLALTQIMRVSAGQAGYLFFGEDLKCRASLDQDGRVLTEIQVSKSVIDRVARDRKPLTILDVGADSELQAKASLMIRNVKSVMCVPLLLDDVLVGLIYVSSASANKTFTRDDMELMTAIAAQIALALQNAQAYEIIKELNQSLEAKVRARTAELELAYRELQETQAQLLETEKLATVGTLAGGVAHEINNPLGAVLTNAQLLMAEIEDPEQLDSLKMIEEGARRCKEIVAALLKYSRPAQASHEPVALAAVVSETMGLLERQAQADGIRLEAALQADPLVMGDPTELRQVFTHLLLNSMDAIRERAGTGRITLTLSRALDGVRLVVADDGAGMPPEVLKRVFDPFFTTKRVGSGTGLGLSVCQRVVEKHGGKLTAVSTPGEGSAFTIWLPAA